MNDPVRNHPAAGRPFRVLLGFAAANVFAGATLQGAQETGSVLSAAAAGLLTLLFWGVIFIPLVALALLPGVVGTRALLRRLGSPSRAARLATGATCWASWGLVVWLAAQAAPIESRPPVGSVVFVLLVFTIQGALFGHLALKPPWDRSSRPAVYAAGAVVLFVIGGGLVTAFRGAVAR